MKVLRNILLLFTLFASTAGGLCGTSWNTLCFGAEGNVQLKTADAQCCLPSHACDSATDIDLACLTASSAPGDHQCIDIPLSPIRLHRPTTDHTRLVASLVPISLAMPAACLAPSAPEVPFSPAQDDPAGDAAFFSCQTIVLRC